MALMAFLGAGTASATRLCKTAVGNAECPSAWRYSGTLDSSLESGTTATLKTTGGFLEDTCNTSSVTGSASAGGGAGVAVTGTITNLAFGGCTNTTTVNNEAHCELELNYKTETPAGSNGTVTGKGCTVTVQLGADCFYGAGTGTTLGTLKEGNPATMEVNAVVRKFDGSGFLCPETSIWEAAYVVTTPASTTLGTSPS